MSHTPEELFRSTAQHYAQYRPGYPPEFFAEVAKTFPAMSERTVLDLGCGTGQIALPLARLAHRVFAVDPEEDMLGAGKALADAQGAANIEWVQGDSFHLDELGLPPLYITTMGASFHWMDRDLMLRDLDRRTEEGGGVVIAGGGRASGRKPVWQEAVDALRTKWLGPERRAGSGTYTHPPEGHEVVLTRSAFSDVRLRTWDWLLHRSLDDIVGLQFSYSFSAPALFGADKPAFQAELRSTLTDAIPEGEVLEQIHTEALIGFRPT